MTHHESQTHSRVQMNLRTFHCAELSVITHPRIVYQKHRRFLMNLNSNIYINSLMRGELSTSPSVQAAVIADIVLFTAK